MTNGQITKKLIAQAKKTHFDANAVKALLNSFPLSSTKMVYDCDEPKYGQHWDAVLACCVETDKAKLESLNRYTDSLGGGPDMHRSDFGRYQKGKSDA